MVWGTLDCGVLSDWQGLFIADLKFGKGHRVEADTPQLKLYALGLADVIGLARSEGPGDADHQPAAHAGDPLRHHRRGLANSGSGTTSR